MSARPSAFDGVDRRHLLAGAGAGAAALVGLAATAPAARADSDTAAGGGNVINDTPASPTLGSAALSGYVYRHVSFFDFTPESTAARSWGGYGTYTTSLSYLWASLDVPAGARVRDIEWYVYNASGTTQTAMARVWKAGDGNLFTPLADVEVTSGSGIRTFRTSVPSANYGPFPLGCKVMLGIPTTGSSNLQINGARVGFSQAAGAIGMLSSPVRAYDSRQVGGLLAAGTTRTVTLPTSVCPVGTTGLVVNLIAVSAEKTGYLRMWPGHVSDTATSAINYTKGTTLANAQMVGVSAARQIKLRSSARTHVVIDVIGTIG